MRSRSLFTRLLVAQGLLAVILTAMLAVLFYGERNLTVAQLFASIWSPTLKELARDVPIDDIRARAPGPVQMRTTRPERVLGVTSMTPRLAIVREQLLERGVPIAAAMYGLVERSPGTATIVWLELRPPGGNVLWVGLESGWVEARLGERAILALLLISGLAIVLSAFVARRLARPLEALRTRIAADDTSGGALPHASAEVQAIDEAWRILRRSLERQERERALLLAGVSHDLRSPLARIRMAAELLPEVEGVAPEREAIVRNAMLADRLIGSFLDHVRSGELVMDEVVDVAAAARNAAGHQRRPASELVVDAPAELLVPSCNASLIERAIDNLLDNALTHGRPPVCLRVSVQAGNVVIEVQDHGPGIAPEQQEYLLQAFARADSSRQRPGLGLGLAVVQRVALRMGGAVGFQRSVDGSANVVRMYWPVEAS